MLHQELETAPRLPRYNPDGSGEYQYNEIAWRNTRHFVERSLGDHAKLITWLINHRLSQTVRDVVDFPVPRFPISGPAKGVAAFLGVPRSTAHAVLNEIETCQTRLREVQKMDPHGYIKRIRKRTGIQTSLATIACDADFFTGRTPRSFGCTDIIIQNGDYIHAGQTLDLDFDEMELIQEESHLTTIVTAPPIPILFGIADSSFSSYPGHWNGMGVFMNYIATPAERHNPDGYPRSFLCMDLIDRCPSMEDALRMCSDTPLSTATSLSLVNAREQVIRTVEIDPDTSVPTRVIEPTAIGNNLVLLHTNANGADFETNNPGTLEKRMAASLPGCSSADRWATAHELLTDGRDIEHVLRAVTVPTSSDPNMLRTLVRGIARFSTPPSRGRQAVIDDVQH